MIGWDWLLPTGVVSILEAVARTHVGEFHLFLLIASRLAGMLLTGPLFGERLIPWHVRAGIVLGLALVMTPVLNPIQHAGANSGFRTESRVGATSDSVNSGPSTMVQGSAPKPVHGGIPSSLIGLMVQLLNEFILGAVVGFGIVVFLIAFQIVGEIIDQQTGVGIGRAADPLKSAGGAPFSGLLVLFSLAIMLLADGHLQMFDAVHATFDIIPPGDALQNRLSLQTLIAFPQQSFVLAVQVAIPCLAMMSLVAMSMGVLGQLVSGLNVMFLAFPVRAMLNIAVLSLMLPGIQRVVLRELPRVLEKTIEGLMS